MYERWEQICKEIVTNDIKEWKQHPDVYNMIEHLPDWIGNEFLMEIEKKENLDLKILKEISLLNDRFGSKLYEYEYKKEKFYISPTTIRYIFHAVEILNILLKKKLNNITFVEIGGGYGGLALILIYLSKTKKYSIKIDKYIMYELPLVSDLQKVYLDQFDFVSGVVSWKNNVSLGKDIEENNYFLISNYTLSTIDIYKRREYLFNLLPKAMSGYMVWNSSNFEGLPYKRIEKDEYPKTGDNNKIIIL